MCVIQSMKQDDNSNPLSKSASKKEAQSLLSKRFKKLKHHISYLNMEHEEIFHIFKQAKEMFISSMFQYCSDNNVSPPFSQEPKEQKSISTKDKESVKELYREIVKQTHPDKTQNLTEAEIESRSELYHQATSGKISGDFNKILQVALDLDIEIGELSTEFLDNIDLEINKMTDKISKMKNDIMYQWYYAEPDQQNQIFQQLTK